MIKLTTKNWDDVDVSDINDGAMSEVTWKGMPIYCDFSGDLSALGKGGVVHALENSDRGGIGIDKMILPSAIRITLKKKQVNLVNADDGVGATKGYAGISMSFRCLTHLIKGKLTTSNKDIRDMLNLFDQNSLWVVDATEDAQLPVSAALKQKHRTASAQIAFNFPKWAKQQTPPEIGFTLIHTGAGNGDMKWHKSAAVLLTTGKRSFLLGQDDGTYFGVELADNPATLNYAYISLMPKEARGKTGVLRQGEWFAVPVPKDPQFWDKDVLVFGDTHLDDAANFTLPIESKESHHHNVHGNYIITAKGEIFVQNFCIEHAEHPSLEPETSTQWYQMLRNTAKASYSMENVD